MSTDKNIMWSETRKIGPNELPTARACYLDGHHTGTWWTSNWYPGGPTHYRASEHERRRADKAWWIAYCEATVENYEEWHRGFKDGHDNRPIRLPEHNVDYVAELGYN